MDLDEARAVLGLDGNIDADSLRRAYLRTLKRFKPERDPEGFQRVRAAYERLEAAPWAWSRPSPADAADARTAQPATVLEPARADSGPPESPATTLDAAAGDGHEAYLGPLFDPVDAAADAAARVEILQRATRERADVAEVFHELASELRFVGAEGWEAEAAEALRAGAAAGHPSCAQRLRAEHPDALDDEDLDALRAERSPGSQRVLAHALAGRGRWDDAADIATDAIARDRMTIGATADPAQWLDLVLRLHQDGAVDAAVRVDRAMRAQVRSAASAASMSPFAQLRFELTRQLGELHRSFPASLRAEIASAIREGDLDLAAEEASDLRERDPSRANAAADALRDHAPDLARVLAPVLSPRHAPAKSTSDPSVRGVTGFVIFLFIMVMNIGRTCSNWRDHPSAIVGTGTSARSSSELTSSPLSGAGSHPRSEHVAALLALQRVCAGGSTDACNAAWRWLPAYEDGRCTVAEQARDAVQAALETPPSDRLSDRWRSAPEGPRARLSDDLFALHAARCGAQEGSPP